jgi:hypothetical protein
MGSIGPQIGAKFTILNSLFTIQSPHIPITVARERTETVQSTLQHTPGRTCRPRRVPLCLHKHDQKPFREAFGIRSPHTLIAVARGRTGTVQRYLQTSAQPTNHPRYSHTQAPKCKPPTNHVHSPERAPPPTLPRKKTTADLNPAPD